MTTHQTQKTDRKLEYNTSFPFFGGYVTPVHCMYWNAVKPTMTAINLKKAVH